MEQVTREEHIDPGVTAAVETGQQHGYNEGHIWGEKQRKANAWCSTGNLHFKSENKGKYVSWDLIIVFRVILS